LPAYFLAWATPSVPGLGLDDGELSVTSASVPFEPADGDRVLAADAAAVDDAPAGGHQGGVDVDGPGFGFVHGDVSQA
jgi:hypothetical protein